MEDFTKAIYCFLDDLMKVSHPKEDVFNLLPEKSTMMEVRDRMSIKTIARKIRSTEGAVKMRILRAKSRARSLLWQLAG